MACKPLGLSQYINAHATRTTEFVKQPANVPAEETWKTDLDDHVDEKVAPLQNSPLVGEGKDPLRSGHSKAWNLSWDEPKPGKRCQGFGTREYTARLWNIPFYANWTKTCENTEATIHGVVVSRPSFCDNKWPFGGVIGHWIVDFGEEDCLARWGKIVDKGCLKPNSNLRRFEARLLNIKKPEDWATICGTAPIKIRGISIPKPTVCENRGFWGVYGVWDFEDKGC
ncbi:hypothetical protein BDN70DRAFT_933627 [Pholiota conissans]|uniref:Uncharacterized protein n=1 Tax=Pholiota conissans TaxID=109636 RepID=A0A9P5Z2A4_9AGAR|nr:hypothetical protein BDN70DRAFT_933627 [Pholiota conissans]